MCGLVGVAGFIDVKIEKTFLDMLHFNVVRGRDSCGVLGIGSAGSQYRLSKTLGSPVDLFYSQGKNGAMSGSNAIAGRNRVLLGHNRAATMGSVTEEEAHPFEFDHIIGAHNGTLWRHDSLMNGDDDKYHELDSKQVFHSIKENGIEWTWKRLEGAAALSWWNDEEETLNFIRNDERPLYFVYSKDKKTMFWASEKGMIFLAAERNKIEVEQNEEGCNLYHKVAENHHYKYKPNFIGINLEHKEELEDCPFNYHNYNFGRGGSRYRPPQQNNRSSNNNSNYQYQWCNQGWTNGLKKAPKDARGISVELNGDFKEMNKRTQTKIKEYFTGQVVSKGKYAGYKLMVYTQSPYHYNSTLPYVGTEETFKLTARPRIDEKRKVLYISSAHLELEEDEHSQKMGVSMFPIKNGSQDDGYYQEEDWKEKMTEILGKPACYNCLGPLLPQEADKFTWIAKDACVCQDCEDSVSYLTSYFGHYNFGSIH